MSGTRNGGAAGGHERRPKHVAIIMDGNGRWAERKGMPRTVGHGRGVERLRDIIGAALNEGVEVLSVFAFSTENWQRPKYEVSVLMALFRRYIVREVDELDTRGIKVRFIGDIGRLPKDLQRMMKQTEKRTAANDGLTLQVCVSYGSRAEITEATRRIAREVTAGRLDPEAIDETTISNSLMTAGIPDPDLVIRTSGELRVSNFLLWQAAYAEYAFIDECWPDFTAERFAEVLEAYGRRDRRFGAVRAAR